MKLSGRAAIVTGGGHGIGRAIALRFAAEGCALTIAGTGGERLEATARELRERGGRARVTLTDVADAMLASISWTTAFALPGDIEFPPHEMQELPGAVFPHWFHRIRFRCKVCHDELGFKMRAGANDVQMVDIANGKFCGMCHNGQVAWGADRCDLCHSGRPGLNSRVYGGNQTLGPGRW